MEKMLGQNCSFFLLFLLSTVQSSSEEGFIISFSENEADIASTEEWAVFKGEYQNLSFLMTLPSETTNIGHALFQFKD